MYISLPIPKAMSPQALRTVLGPTAAAVALTVRAEPPRPHGVSGPHGSGGGHHGASGHAPMVFNYRLAHGGAPGKQRILFLHAVILCFRVRCNGDVWVHVSYGGTPD